MMFLFKECDFQVNHLSFQGRKLVHPLNSYIPRPKLECLGFMNAPKDKPRPKKPGPTFTIESWLVNRDPHNGLLYIIPILYNWVGFHPLYNPTKQGPFFHCSDEC